MCVAGRLCVQKPEKISSLDHLVPITLKQDFPESGAYFSPSKEVIKPEKSSCL